MSCNHCKNNLGIMCCGQCKNIKYCSKECQKIDWKNHKPCCLPKITKEMNPQETTIAQFKKNNKFMDILHALCYCFSTLSHEHVENRWNLGNLLCLITKTDEMLKHKDKGTLYNVIITWGTKEITNKIDNVNVIWKYNHKEKEVWQNTVTLNIDQCETFYELYVPLYIHSLCELKSINLLISDNTFCQINNLKLQNQKNRTFGKLINKDHNTYGLLI